jgi:hypothetical protein
MAFVLSSKLKSEPKSRVSSPGRLLHVAQSRVNDVQSVRYPVDREILDLDGVEVVN